MSHCISQFPCLPQVPDVLDSFLPWSCAACSTINLGQFACKGCQQQAPSQKLTSQINGKHWQCVCGYASNPGVRCNHCRQAKPSAPWKCVVCGLESSSHENCEECKHPKGEQAYEFPQTQTSKESPRPWTCQCTYEHNLEPACLKCKAFKPAPPGQPNPRKNCCLVF